MLATQAKLIKLQLSTSGTLRYKSKYIWMLASHNPGQIAQGELSLSANFNWKKKIPMITF